MSDALHDRVLAFIADERSDDFDALALAVFARQYEAIEPYRRICDGRGRTPATVDDWRLVPPVPARVFKDVVLRTGPAQRVFLSTGTTLGAEQRSRHEMPDLRLYRAAAVRGLRDFVFPDVETIRVLSLIWSSAARPESSLAQMGDWALEEFGRDGSGCFVAGERFDFAGLVQGLRASEKDGEPACILTTTGALLHFLDYCRDENLIFRLPHSSRLMDTGGSKGAPRTMSRNGLLRAIWETLAIPGYHVVNEYGMSELSSQFYDDVLRNRVRGHFAARAKAVPHWVRTRMLDPLTLAESAEATGLLCHFDLANAGTAACVLTEDIGRSCGEGFEVIGRAAGAETRGCSLAASEMIAAKSDLDERPVEPRSGAS